MRYAVNVPNFEDYGDVRTVAGLAADAEAAGWDGFFVWDHLAFVKAWKLRIADPWLLLAGVALATERLRLGPMVTPLARRRPWKVARETVTLDRLSGGRLVLGVGLGEPAADEFGSFGEPTDPRVRAAMLDEGLEVLTRLWSGETVSFSGRHYRVDEVAFQPPRRSGPASPSGWPAPGRAAARCAGRPASTAAPRSSSTTRASWSPWTPRTSAGCWPSSASSARPRGRSTCWSAESAPRTRRPPATSWRSWPRPA